MVEFSIVCPIKDEVDLIPRTLPSFYAVNPSEVVLCLDKPAPKHVIGVIEKVAEACKAGDMTRIIEVERNPEYAYHQAWVRRKGFMEAKHCRILTTDIDLVINRNVLKAVEMVGNDDIGLVSLNKFRYPNSLIRFLRLLGTGILQKYVHFFAEAYRGRGIAATTFTGLYAVWKDHWLDSEPQEELKKLKSSKTPLRRGEKVVWDSDIVRATGEDTFLRDRMEEKHKVVYLPDIGGFVLTDPMEDLPVVQFKKGIYFCLSGRNLLGALARTVFRLQPHYLCGHLYGRKLVKSKKIGSRL